MLEVLGFKEEVDAQEKRAGDSTAKPVVVLRSDNPTHSLAIEELQGVDARRKATAYAGSKGIIKPSVEMPSAPYPVTKEGGEIVRPTEQKIDHYRVDVPISTGF